MSNIRLKTITIETSNDLTIKNGNTVFLNTTENSILTNGGVRIANTQDATALTTGALSISGGLSILKNTLMDGNLNLTNTNAQFNIINKLNITNSLFEFSPNGVDNLITMTDNKMSILSTNPSSNLSSGALIISGGLTILTTDNSAITTNGGALTIMGGSYFNGKLRCQDQVSLTATVNTVGNITINNTNTGINVASPNFALDVNGIVNTNGRFITRVSAGGFNPNFTAYPLIDGEESSIAFYNNTTGSVASQGNVWIMGHNVWGSGNRTFGIGTPHAGSILTMNTSGQTQFNNNVNIVRSNTTPSLVISGGITSGNGANIVLKGGGLVGSSVNIDLSTYDHTTNAPTSRIQAVDENFSSNLILMTKIPGSATNALQSRMYIRNDGNIGINTTTPTHLLHVNGDTLLTGLTTSSIQTTNINTTNATINSLINTSSTISNTRITGQISIFKNTSGWNAGLVFRSPTIGDETFMFFSNSPTNSLSSGSWLIGKPGADDRFEISYAGFAQPLLCARTTGNFGISTNNPLHKLHINGGLFLDNNTSGILLDAANRPLITRGWDAFTSGIYNGAGRWGLFMEGARINIGLPNGILSNFGVSTYNADSSIADTPFFVNGSSGNVGIGTITPSYKLHVVGDSLMTGLTTTTILTTNATMTNLFLTNSTQSSGLITNITNTNILNTNLSSSSINVSGRVLSRVSAGGFNSNFTAFPITDTNECAISFFQNTAGSTASAGSVWTIGHNVFGSGNRTFTIGTPILNSILTMNTSGQTQFNYNVNIIRSNTTPSLVISGGITAGNGANIVLKGGGLVGSSVNIDLSTYDHTTNAPTSRIQAVDENFSSNLILMTKIPGSATNALQSRMYIRNDGNIGINTTTPTHLLHINGTVLATGQTVISNTTNSISTTTGSLIVSGGVGINNNLYVGNDVNILGSLTVNGNTSFVNTTNIEIKDNLILLNSAPLGTSDSGMFIQRFQSSNDSNLGDVVNDTTFSSQTLPSQSALTNTEIRLDPSSSSVDNFYNGWWIKVVSGFSSNQVRQIISYNGTSKIATINSNWTTQNPSQTDIINLYNKPFAGIIYNELSDTFEFISSNIRPTSSSLNITDYLPVKLSKLNINDTSFNSVISNGGFVSLNTQNSLNLTSGGCLTLYGGSSISKDLLLGGSLIFPNKNNVVLNPNSDDRLSTQQFTAANNQTLQPITNLSFTSDTWGFDVYLSARVQSSVNQFCNYHIRGVNKVSSWTISYTSTGDNMGLVFDISTSGNLLYSSPNYSSFSSLIFKFKAITN